MRKYINTLQFILLLTVITLNVNAQSSHFNLVDKSNIEVGNDAPDVVFEDLAGKKVKLSDYKDKIVLLDVWATWCVPCLKALPEMDKVYRAHAGETVMLAVCSADTRANFEKFVKANKDKYACTFLFDPAGAKSGVNDFRYIYGVNGFPTTMVIDKEQRVRGYGFNHEEIDGLIVGVEKEYLAAATPYPFQDVIDDNRNGKYEEAYRKSKLLKLTDPSLQNDLVYTQVESLLHIDQKKGVELAKSWSAKINDDYQFLCNIGDLIAQTKDLSPETYLYGAEVFMKIIAKAPADTDFMIVYDLTGRCYYKGGNTKLGISYATKSLEAAIGGVQAPAPETVAYLEKVLATYTGSVKPGGQ